MAVETSSKTPGARRVPDRPGTGPGFAAIALTGLGVVVIAACAVLLSYNGIYQIARQGNIDPRPAHLYPGGFTLLLLMAFWTGYVLRAAPRSRRLWVDALILAMILLAAGASALEATGQRLLPQVAVVLTAVAPWLALLAAFRFFLWVWMHLRGEFPDDRPRRAGRDRPRGRRREPGPDDPTDVLTPVPATTERPGGEAPEPASPGRGEGEKPDGRADDDVAGTARLAPVPPAEDGDPPARGRTRGPGPLWPRPPEPRRGGTAPSARVPEQGEQGERRRQPSPRPEPPESSDAQAPSAPATPAGPPQAAEPPLPARREPADLIDPEPGTPPQGSRLPDTAEPLPSAAADDPRDTAADPAVTTAAAAGAAGAAAEKTRGAAPGPGSSPPEPVSGRVAEDHGAARDVRGTAAEADDAAEGAHGAHADGTAGDARGPAGDTPDTAIGTAAGARPPRSSASAGADAAEAGSADDTDLPRRTPGGMNAIKRAAAVQPVGRPLTRAAGTGASEGTAADAADEGFVHDPAPDDPTTDEAEPGTLPVPALPLPGAAAPAAPVPADIPAAGPATRPEQPFPAAPAGPGRRAAPAEGERSTDDGWEPEDDRPIDEARPAREERSADEAAQRGDAASVPAPSGPAFPAAAPIEKRPMVLKPRRMPMRGFPPPDPPSRRVRSQPRPPKD
ncbi:hypothetical protein ACFO4E_12755 [Nocardiopsis mangrovi]|uniref:DUF2637 domain-containing protein n=1 Tax=Nocardiopsis mangrovi TaxID=1179818 RepID=A0ABV9DXT3_9ACTN